MLRPVEITVLGSFKALEAVTDQSMLHYLAQIYKGLFKSKATDCMLPNLYCSIIVIV